MIVSQAQVCYIGWIAVKYMAAFSKAAVQAAQPDMPHDKLDA